MSIVDHRATAGENWPRAVRIDGHVDGPFEVFWNVHSKDHPVAVTYLGDTLTGEPYTTLPDATVLQAGALQPEK